VEDTNSKFRSNTVTVQTEVIPKHHEVKVGTGVLTVIVLRKFLGSSGSSKGYAPTSIT
jgi:hypothetical protein